MTKSYSQMVQLKTYEDRLLYLMEGSVTFEKNFGGLRQFSNKFYKSNEWLSVRNQVIVRDNGCDLAVPGMVIAGKVYVHHIVPICYADLESRSPLLFDLENLITTSHRTHNIIHYGDLNLYKREYPSERKPGDTTLWRN